MRQKTILVGKEGKSSLSGVFAQMKTTESSLIVKGQDKKLNRHFKLYTEQDIEKFTKVRDVSLNDSVIIRWGTRVQIPENGAIVYNSNKSITNASNKHVARKLLQQAGVSIPKLVTTSNFDIEDLPIIARPFQHRQGKNFIVIKDFGSFNEFYRKNAGEWYFSAYIEKDSEFRVHCAHGKILSIMQKPRPADPTVMAWNHAVVEEAFDAVRWADWDITLGKTVLRACKALGLDFAAFDVIVKDGIPYVLEANTCPSLTTSPYNTEKYAKYFDWLLRKSERREHWEFEEKKKATSLAWKEWMFEDRKPNTANPEEVQ